MIVIVGLLERLVLVAERWIALEEKNDTAWLAISLKGALQNILLSQKKNDREERTAKINDAWAKIRTELDKETLADRERWQQIEKLKGKTGPSK